MKKLFSLPDNYSYHVLVAPSVCLEETITLDAGDSFSKVPSHVESRIAGTSFNTAFTLSQIFGLKVKLLGLIGRKANEHSGGYIQTRMPRDVEFHPLAYADRTSMSHVIIDPENRFSPISGKVLSTKGVCVDPVAAGKEIAEQVFLCRPAVRIASGIPENDACLAKALLEKPGGLRLLNPRPDLIQAKDHFFELLHYCELLIINHEEFGLIVGREIDETAVEESDLKKLHDLGVPFVLITCNQHGLVFSGQDILIREKAFRYGKVESPVGAGDAFTAGLVGSIFQDLPIEEGLRRAAIYAGLKLTFTGGSSIPPRELFEKVLREN